MNLEFPEYYKKPVGRWLESEGFVFEGETEARRRDLYLFPAATKTHIVFALCREKGDQMVFALKLKRNRKDALFVARIKTLLCSKS